jgi:hypothetical protein
MQEEAGGRGDAESAERKKKKAGVPAVELLPSEE